MIKAMCTAAVSRLQTCMNKLRIYCALLPAGSAPAIPWQDRHLRPSDLLFTGIIAYGRAISKRKSPTTEIGSRAFPGGRERLSPSLSGSLKGLLLKRHLKQRFSHTSVTTIVRDRINNSKAGWKESGKRGKNGISRNRNGK